MADAFHIGTLSTSSLSGFKSMYGVSLASASPYSALYLTGTGTEYSAPADKKFVGYLAIVSNWQTSVRLIDIYYDDDGAGTNITYANFGVYVPAACCIAIPTYFEIPANKHIRAYGSVATNCGIFVIGREE